MSGIHDAVPQGTGQRIIILLAILGIVIRPVAREDSLFSGQARQCSVRSHHASRGVAEATATSSVSVYVSSEGERHRMDGKHSRK
jgi:hypothetical protein